MNGKYRIVFGLKYVTCVSCHFRYDTELGDFGSESEALAMAETLHKDNDDKRVTHRKEKCRNRKLIVELSNLRYEVNQ